MGVGKLGSIYLPYPSKMASFNVTRSIGLLFILVGQTYTNNCICDPLKKTDKKDSHFLTTLQTLHNHYNFMQDGV